MRRLLLALIVLFVGATAATGVRLHALSECERWIAEYRDALAHSPTMQRAKAAKHRLHHVVHPKTAAKTKPRVLSARYMRPKYTKEELLHRMQFACSDLDLLDPTLDMVASNEPPVFQSDDQPGDNVSPMSQQSNPTETQAGGYPLSGVPFVPTGSTSTGGAGTPGGGGSGGTGTGGGSGTGTGGGSGTGTTPGGGGGTGGGGGENPGGGGNPGGGNPPPPPTAVAPEPDSLILLATGLVGAAGVIRRRVPR